MTHHILAIDGIDGAGKTRFAERLRGECVAHGLSTELVRVDDFRHRVDWNRGDEPESDLYYDDYYDFAGVEACLRAFANGEPSCRVPVFDPLVERVTGTRELRLQGTEVLILEGVFTLRVAAVARGTLVYLATSYDEARRRIIERDQVKERTLEEVLHRVDLRYFPSQRRYHAEHAPESRADVVIDNEDVSNPRTKAANIAEVPSPVWAAIEALAPMA